jgi:hypothetical protein
LVRNDGPVLVETRPSSGWFGSNSANCLNSVWRHYRRIEKFIPSAILNRAVDTFSGVLGALSEASGACLTPYPLPPAVNSGANALSGDVDETYCAPAQGRAPRSFIPLDSLVALVDAAEQRAQVTELKVLIIPRKVLTFCDTVTIAPASQNPRSTGA